jgi:hypothetical protein
MKDFFKDPAFQNQLRQASADARKSIDSMEAITEVSSGDCFLFAESDDLPLRWVAVLRHKDDPAIWFLLAADEFAKVGTCDIEIPESNPMAPLIMRGNVGLWAHQDDIDLDRYVGRLDSESVADAKSRLSEMVNGEVPVTEHGMVAEANEDYRDWIAELTTVCQEIETRLQAEPVVLLRPVFDTSYTELSVVAECRAVYDTSLAADANGTSDSESDAPPSLALKSSLPGQLLLQKDGDDFDLVYFPGSPDDHPPRLVRAAGLSVNEGEWLAGADGVCTWTQPLSSVDGRVSFVIAGSAFDIAVS